MRDITIKNCHWLLMCNCNKIIYNNFEQKTIFVNVLFVHAKRFKKVTYCMKKDKKRYKCLQNISDLK